ATAENIVGVASGCTAQLVEYGLVAGDSGAAFARKVRDVHAFIASHPGLDRLRFRPLRARALLHTPCTLRNVIKTEGAVRALLERIPELRIDAVDSACCGAAGSYFLTQPQMADGLLQGKLDQVDAALPDFIL